MREGVRRLIVAIKVVSYLWLAGCVVACVVRWDSPEGPLIKSAMAAFAMLPGFAGLGLAWILQGFARPERKD